VNWPGEQSAPGCDQPFRDRVATVGIWRALEIGSVVGQDDRDLPLRPRDDPYVGVVRVNEIELLMPQPRVQLRHALEVDQLAPATSENQ